MIGHDIIVVGASAGGIETLREFVRGLPADLPAAVFVVQHVGPGSPGILPEILGRACPLPVAHAVHEEAITHGRVYVAPPDLHLLLRRGRVHLSRGARENRSRPAIDVLFRSAARAYACRVVGVVLSGALDDGTMGLMAVKMRGGVAIVQDPAEALVPSMPVSAIENVAVDHVLPVAAMAPLLSRLAHEPISENGAMLEDGAMDTHSEMRLEDESADLAPETMSIAETPGAPSPFACPECGGVLNELREGGLVRFRCQVGHAFSVGNLMQTQEEELEEALWIALRTLEERAALTRRMIDRTAKDEPDGMRRRFTEEERSVRERMALIRRVLASGAVGGDAEAMPALAAREQIPAD